MGRIESSLFAVVIFFLVFCTQVTGRAVGADRQQVGVGCRCCAFACLGVGQLTYGSGEEANRWTVRWCCLEEALEVTITCLHTYDWWLLTLGPWP